MSRTVPRTARGAGGEALGGVSRFELDGASGIE